MIESRTVLGISFGHQRARRWAVAIYWSWVTIFSIAFLHHQAREGLDGLNALLVVLMIANLSALLGGVRSGGAVKPFLAVPWRLFSDGDDLQRLFSAPPPVMARRDESDTNLDEREIRLRDRIHFIAYTFSRWFALLLFAVYAGLSTLNAAWLIRIGPFFFFLLALVLWSLPQSLILWMEPDMEEQV